MPITPADSLLSLSPHACNYAHQRVDIIDTMSQSSKFIPSQSETQLKTHSGPSPEHIADLINNHTADLSWQQVFYDDLHEHPELSHQEERTAAAIQVALQRFDVEVTTGIGGHGIVAVMRNHATEHTPTALMRADFDALFVDG